MANPSLITPAVIEPLHIAEVKAHLRVDFTDDDNLLRALISTARQYAEGFLNRALLTSTWDCWLTEFPDEDYIKIPYPPLQSVTSVKYYNTDGTEATQTATEYIVNAVDEPGKITLAYGKTWPSEVLRPDKGVVIRYIAGYAAYSGTVTTVGTVVTKASGSDFNTAWLPGKTIIINGVAYTIASVASTSSLTLTATAGTQASAAPYQANDIPENIRQGMILHVEANYDADNKDSERIKRAMDALLWLNRVTPL